MIRESLILGSLLRLWESLAAWYGKTKLAAAVERFCSAVGRAWHESVIVSGFCSPHGYEKADGAVWNALRSVVSRLKLPKLLQNSIFLRACFWCALAVALAPVLPTMALLALAAVGCGATLLAQLCGERDGRSPIALPALCYLGFYLLGTLTSHDRGSSLYICVLTVAFVLFSLLVSRAVRTDAQARTLAVLLIAAAAAVSCYGIMQYLFGWGYQSKAWVDDEMFSAIGFRVTSTLQNPNMLGQYLVLLFPAAFAGLLTRRGVWRKLFYLACCGVMAVCLILTFSRGAWLALLLACALMLLMLRPRLLILIPFALVLLWLLLPASIKARFASIGNLGDSSTSYRVYIWLGSLRMILDGHWLVGVGPGEAAFNAVYPLYAYNAVIAPHSHNLFLQTVCDAGIGALAGLLWALVRWFRALCGALRREEDRARRVWQAAFIAGTFGFLVQAMTDYSFYNYRVMFVFWTYLTVGLLFARRRERGGIAV